MNIVYACDDKYSMIVGTSIQSLCVNNAEISDLQIYVLSNEVTKDNKSKIVELAGYHGRDVHFINVTEDVLGNNDVRLDVQRWSVAAFARLYTPRLLPNLNRIIYLDCDVMVNGSLTPLWETDMGVFSCAAVAEPFSAGHKRNVRLKASDNYFNSGVMLIDLDKWRTENIEKSFEACISRHRGHVPYVDQGVLNEVFNGRIHMLPAKCNVYTEHFDLPYEETEKYRADRFAYSREEVAEAVSNPVIVHFVSSFLTARPWIIGSDHPYTPQWMQYRAATPWKNDPLWESNPGKAKTMLKWIFTHTPRVVGIWIARTVNSVIRPIIDR